MVVYRMVTVVNKEVFLFQATATPPSRDTSKNTLNQNNVEELEGKLVRF
jgi:hypothetical protein